MSAPVVGKLSISKRGRLPFPLFPLKPAGIPLHLLHLLNKSCLAPFCIRYDPVIRRYYQRKLAKSKKVVALKTVAHKLARACYWIMKKGEPFEVERAFG